jgi:hypothetical protein
MSLIIVSCSCGQAQNQDPYNDNDDSYYNDNSNYNEQQSDNDGMSYQTFYDQLSPYGSWVNYPGYGYVWVPQVNEGFSPYQTDGQWEYTDMGWTWVSDYAWGWAAFHYGSWVNDPNYGGWLWVPGYDWAPAWVTWGTYGDYYCWAPLGPRDYVNGHWGYGAYDHNWNCVPRGHMGEAGIGRYVVSNTVVNHNRFDFERHVSIITHNNTYGHSVFNAGPRVEDVQKAVGHPINRLSISNSNKPEKTGVHGNTVNIYRPSVSRSADVQHTAIPTKVVNPAEVQHNESPARNNGSPARNDQPRTSSPERSSPERENTGTERSLPSHSSYSPPRQSTPEQEHSSGNGFIPSERAEPARSAPEPARSAPEPRSAPAPSFHAAPAGGGGGVRSGGGRHR